MSKIADRPHSTQLFLTISAVVIAVASAYFSYGALRVNRENLAANRENTRMVNRAYVTLQNPRAIKTDGISTDANGRKTAGVIYRFELDVVNLGNTPAHEVQLSETARSPSCSLTDCMKEIPFNLGPRDKRVLIHDPFIPNLSAETFQPFENAPKFYGHISYKDDFGETRSIDWCYFEYDTDHFKTCEVATPVNAS